MRLAALILFTAALFAQPQAAPDFQIKDGDRIVFYGDSITDARLYTTFVETFIATRYPARKVVYTHSGWGGDKVNGGGGGNIDTRLTRDVFPYKPTVVTIMLGMNDGRYRSFDAGIYNDYISGYEAMVKKIKQALPGVRITAIRPSPYDEVAKPVMPPTGYNTVMVQFGNWIQEFAKREPLHVADLNAPFVRMMERAKEKAGETEAARIISDRVHPGPSGHLIMAGALVRSWGAQGRVSFVEIDSAAGAVKEQGRTKISGFAKANGLTWTQQDESLPMPVDWEDPVMKLAVESSDFTDALNRQNLKITGLDASHYALRIDGQQVAVFTKEDLDRGVNLTLYPTPMMKQAAEVHALTLKRANTHNTRWRALQVPFANDGLTKLAPAMAALDALNEELAAKQRAAAQPLARKYELIPVPANMSVIPPGFTPIFNGKDLTGWHISQTNHHGRTKAWVVEADGVLTGAQDKPGHGGILLTDKKYKNFEVFMEINPDWGCDGGLFLRSSEKGEAYQAMLDHLPNGNIGGVYGERLTGVSAPNTGQRLGSTGLTGWTRIRARIEGDNNPRIRVWLNDRLVTNFTDNLNRAADGAIEGMIAVQVHLGNRWTPGGKHRFRNIAVRELP